MAVAPYYRRVLKHAGSETKKLCAPHWWWKALGGALGGVVAFAILRAYRGESVWPENWDPLIAATGGAAMVWVTTFLFRLVLAPVELASEADAELAKLGAQVATLKQAQEKPPLTAMQREKVKVLDQLFGDCDEDQLRVLGRLADGPIINAAFIGSSDTLPGGNSFMKRCWGPAMMQGVTESVRDDRGQSYFCVVDSWRSPVRRYVNDRLDQAAINSASDHT